MKIYNADADIVTWLNHHKKLEIAGELKPISVALHGKPDDLSGAGHYFEGLPPRGIQFLDSKGEGSVLSSAPDDEKKGCCFKVNTDTFVWVREGEEQILDLVEHNYRLVSLTG